MTTIDTITGVVVHTDDARSQMLAERVELNRRLLQAGVPVNQIRSLVDLILAGEMTLEEVTTEGHEPGASNAEPVLRRVVISDSHQQMPKRPVPDARFRGPNRRGFSGKGGHSFR